MPDASARARTLIALRPQLQRAAKTAAVTSASGARLVAQALLSRSGHPAFGAFTDSLDAVPATLRREAQQAAQELTKYVAPAFASLSNHPDASLRKAALRVLTLNDLDQHRHLVVRALSDPDESVRALALDLLGEARTPSTALAVAQVLREAKRWPLRMHAAMVLGAYQASGLPKQARAILQRTAQHDEFAFVRLACVRALGGDPQSHDVLQRIADSDDEPAVRRPADHEHVARRSAHE
jgi:HEAT repeat protein